MPERLNGPVSKTGSGLVLLVGSNPTLSVELEVKIGTGLTSRAHRAPCVSFQRPPPARWVVEGASTPYAQPVSSGGAGNGVALRHAPTLAIGASLKNADAGRRAGERVQALARLREQDLRPSPREGRAGGCSGCRVASGDHPLRLILSSRRQRVEELPVVDCRWRVLALVMRDSHQDRARARVAEAIQSLE